MKTQKLLLLLAVAAAALLVFKKQDGPQATGGSGEPNNSPVAQVVEETLHQHEGEDNPIVHAFEEALEHKAG